MANLSTWRLEIFDVDDEIIGFSTQYPFSMSPLSQQLAPNSSMDYQSFFKKKLEKECAFVKELFSIRESSDVSGNVSSELSIHPSDQLGTPASSNMNEEIRDKSNGSMNLAHEKRIKRKISNRESAKQCRMRKLYYENEVHKQTEQLRFEFPLVQKKLHDSDVMHKESASLYRVAEAESQTAEAKVKLAEQVIRQVIRDEFADMPILQNIDMQSLIQMMED